MRQLLRHLPNARPPLHPRRRPPCLPAAAHCWASRPLTQEETAGRSTRKNTWTNRRTKHKEEPQEETLDLHRVRITHNPLAKTNLHVEVLLLSELVHRRLDSVHLSHV